MAETGAWLRRAVDDLRAGEHDLKAKPPLVTDAAFHAQQAVEKTLKGFLSWHDRVFGKTHNLVELGEACAAVNSDLAKLVPHVAPLTEYAWKFRYPGDVEAPPKNEVRDALGLARQVYETVAHMLPREVAG